MEFPLVDTQWLETHLYDEDVVVLDASMTVVIGKEPILYDDLVCLPRTRKFDLETVFCDLDSPQVHAFPPRSTFFKEIAQLGIRPTDTVIIYDNQGIYSSPRAWWIFKVMGFDKVFVLDGGLPQWQQEDRLTSSRYQSLGIDFQVSDIASTLIGVNQELSASRVCDAQTVLAMLNSGRAQADGDTVIIDARGAGRFLGQVSEPRAGVRSGHIPHSVNLPFAQVLDGYKLKSTAELASIFAEIAGEKPLRVFSCGSGITACILILASVVSGHDNAVLYDGSWADWGSDHSLPIV